MDKREELIDSYRIRYRASRHLLRMLVFHLHDFSLLFLLLIVCDRFADALNDRSKEASSKGEPSNQIVLDDLKTLTDPSSSTILHPHSVHRRDLQPISAILGQNEAKTINALLLQQSSDLTANHIDSSSARIKAFNTVKQGAAHLLVPYIERGFYAGSSIQLREYANRIKFPPNIAPGLISIKSWSSSALLYPTNYARKSMVDPKRGVQLVEDQFVSIGEKASRVDGSARDGKIESARRVRDMELGHQLLAVVAKASPADRDTMVERLAKMFPRKMMIGEEVVIL